MGIMNGMDLLTSEINDLKNLMAEYEGYQVVQPSAIHFREPEDPTMKALAKKGRQRTSFIVCAVSIAFWLMPIMCIIQKNKLSLTIMMIVLALVPTVFAIKSLTQKPLITTGELIYKRVSGIKTSHENREYSCTVIPDNEGKVMLRDLQITKSDFYKVDKGSRVVIIKTGATSIVYPYPM